MGASVGMPQSEIRLALAADLPRIGNHPVGVHLLSAVEFWERFSFYGLSGLLILYLVADGAHGGLGVDRRMR